MPSPDDFLKRFCEIVEYDVTDPQASLHLHWDNREEGRAILQRLRMMQKELRFLKKEVSATEAEVKSEYATAKMRVGKTVTSALAAGFFGRRTVGRFNSAQRDSLRRSQVSVVAPYDRVKQMIDQIIAKLDHAKSQVELSPEYQMSASTHEVSNSPERFYVYLGEEVKGPYSHQQLIALFEMQTITQDTMCCREGSEEWQAYNSIKA